MMQTTTPLPDSERLAWLRLIRTHSIGAVTFWELLERFGSAEAAIAALPGIVARSRRARKIDLVTIADAKREWQAIEEFGARIVLEGEAEYPSMLTELEAPPPLLIVKGAAETFKKPIVAIVGARNASALGQRFARELAAQLGQAGLTVASGLARGIDTAAHRGSLPTGTIAVMAGGVNIIYPPENKDLYNSIAASGAVVSEMPFSLQPTAQHFPRRNRIISGLARGVLVVEATLNSGSLITARLAGEQGRDVFAVPGSPLDPRCRGTNSLIRQGAVLTETIDDILSTLNLETALPAKARRTRRIAQLPSENTGALQTEIIRRLGPNPVEIDELIRLLGASPSDVSAAILDLELMGELTRHAGQRVSLSSWR